MFIDTINNNGKDYMFGGMNTIITCSTGASTLNKIATTELPFEIHNELSFKIKFTSGSNVDNAKLNINSTGEKPIEFTGSKILEPNITYDCHFNGESYVINNSCYELEGKTWRETALNGLYIDTNTEQISTQSGTYTFTPSDTAVGSVNLSAGSVVRITFRYALQTSYTNGITEVRLNYGGCNGPIVAQRGEASNGYTNIKSHVFSGGNYSSTYNKKVWDKYTTLELMWIGNAWLVMGNPVLCSYFSTTQSYTVYANGLIKQYFCINQNGSFIYTNNQVVNFPVRFNNKPYFNFPLRYEYPDSGTTRALYPRVISTISWTMFIINIPTGEGDSFVFEGY